MLKYERLDKLAERSLNMILYGASGTGKTTALKGLGGRIFCINIDDGLVVLKGEDIDIVSVTPTTRKELEEVTSYFERNLDKFDTIVLDTAIELEKVLLIEAASKSASDQPKIQDYGVIGFFFERYMRRLKRLSLKGKNVIVITGERSTVSSEGVKARPAFRESIMDSIEGLFDVIARTGIVKKEYMTRLAGTASVTAKDRIGKREVIKTEELFNEV